MLCEALKSFPSLPEDDDDENSQRKRPRLTEILDEEVHVGISATSMQEAMHVHHNLARFPILAFSNEPLSHLANKDVRNALENVPDKIHHECNVSDKLHNTFLDHSAYENSVPVGRNLLLSAAINIESVVVNDGDGVILGVNPSSDTPLHNATYTRLNRIDAPELFAVHYVRNEVTNQVLHQFKGHSSLLGMQFFLDLFVRKGSAHFHYELPRIGRPEPKDHYGRPLKEFWFQFLTSPSERELRILDAIIQKCDGLDAYEKVVLMSPFNPRLATVASPFYLCLNALLVLSGNSHVFTRFCQDKRMLKLQRVARENQIGPLYCGLTRNHVIGIEVDTSDDVNLSPFAAVNVARLRNQGYPDWNMSQDGTITGLLPWHERSMKHKVFSFTRSKARDHLVQHRSPTSAVYGFFIDIDRNCTRSHYTPVHTAEGHLQVRPSRCVGIGGQSTGDGLFTVKPIQPDTFVCAYAPTAPVRRFHPQRQGDYLITCQGEGNTVDVDGAENEFETGLGRICNDGAFPLALVRSKFAKIIDDRVNCKFAKRNGEVWIKSNRYIRANEELMVCYTENLGYWKSIFSDEQLQRMKMALQSCPPTLRDAEQAIAALAI